MDPIPTPSVPAFLVCDQVIEDTTTRKKSLIGTFTHLQSPGFPFQHSLMGVYFCVTDADGLCMFELDLVCLNTDQVMFKATLPPCPIADRLQHTDFGLNIQTIVFPIPGRYEFRLRLQGRLIAQKDFLVIQAPLPQPNRS